MWDLFHEVRELAKEARLARLDHPYIAREDDAGATDEGRPFFSLEFVDGSPPVDWTATS